MKSYLLDTNVVSEWIKPRPDSGVMEWLDHADEDRLYLSVATIAEIRRGVERLPTGKRKERLAMWLSQDLPDRFERRLLDVDTAVAHAWGRVAARTEAAGWNIGLVDALIAATAESHQLELVTRNVKHFAPTGVPVVNPWHN